MPARRASEDNAAKSRIATHQAQMTSSEEERFVLLIRASHFDDEPKALEALGALDMNTICKLLATDATFAEGMVAPGSLATLVQGMAAAVTNGDDVLGKADGTDAQKAAAASTKKSLRQLVSHCRDGHTAARERERSGPRPTGDGIDHTTRKSPLAQRASATGKEDGGGGRENVQLRHASRRPSRPVHNRLHLLGPGRWNIEDATAALRVGVGLAERHLD